MMFWDSPKWVPVQVYFLPATQKKYGSALNEIMSRHKRLFPKFECIDPKEIKFKDLYVEGEVVDCWGCVWKNLHGGLVGKVTVHPLGDWANFEDWKKKIPDPEVKGLLGPRNWEELREQIKFKEKMGLISPDYALPHGFHFMLMWDLRGFENFMLDMLTDEPNLNELMEILINYNRYCVVKTLDLGTRFLGLAEDLGMQNSLPISKDLWDKYVKPGYKATMGIAKERGVPVFFHSDGYIIPLISDLIELGVTLLNPQSGANGVENLREVALRRVALCIDIDRQILPYASNEGIKSHIDQIFKHLYLPEGGLMLSIEINEDVPLETMDYLFSIVEDYCSLPSPEDTNFSSVGFG
ncbi:MAG: hypothetical protein N3G21_08015 [Candidatus Hydrogenedentes bacterium]|nr:hypothetical protein [Candidatus Hydrogenedentota bacterium]